MAMLPLRGIARPAMKAARWLREKPRIQPLFGKTRDLTA